MDFECLLCFDQPNSSRHKVDLTNASTVHGAPMETDDGEKPGSAATELLGGA